MTNKNFFAGVLAAFALTFTSSANAYPVYAQNGYENPREATGRIVCANCHLAQKPVDIEVPQAVLPDTVFEAVVKIPYDQQVKQVLGNGKKGPLNVGAVLILPEDSKLHLLSVFLQNFKKKLESFISSHTVKIRRTLLLLDLFQVRNIVK